ncbi:MAG: hypothetical protein AAFU33_28655 [Bacteroidota bacterium]
MHSGFAIGCGAQHNAWQIAISETQRAVRQPAAAAAAAAAQGGGSNPFPLYDSIYLPACPAFASAFACGLYVVSTNLPFGPPFFLLLY